MRFKNNIAAAAAGSTLIEWGNTRVICGVSLEEAVPRWIKEQGVQGGWLTAEYSMLPYSTHPRKQRDAARGRIEGRTQEIQRLIGRAMRAAVDLEKLGPRTLWIDCDVLQADGGTRTAAITGGYVALRLAVQKLLDTGVLKENPLNHFVAAVSVGIVNQTVLADLCYAEDVIAEVDMNLVMTSIGEFVELQGTGEKASFTEAQLNAMLATGRAALKELFRAQEAAIAAG
ncbi:MAG: ribonuclease PH [Candidatus Omnitrophica bacterium]|nr:ribonuclease PH [Candidatus Omnitrophota bacterium]